MSENLHRLVLSFTTLQILVGVSLLGKTKLEFHPKCHFMPFSTSKLFQPWFRFLVIFKFQSPKFLPSQLTIIKFIIINFWLTDVAKQRSNICESLWFTWVGQLNNWKWPACFARSVCLRIGPFGTGNRAGARFHVLFNFWLLTNRAFWNRKSGWSSFHVLFNFWLFDKRMLN